ncbi:MAG: GGDEF domain-containing protein [Cellvibrionaceae bacterium]
MPNIAILAAADTLNMPALRQLRFDLEDQGCEVGMCSALEDIPVEAAHYQATLIQEPDNTTHQVPEPPSITLVDLNFLEGYLTHRNHHSLVIGIATSDTDSALHQSAETYDRQIWDYISLSNPVPVNVSRVGNALRFLNQHQRLKTASEHIQDATVKDQLTGLNNRQQFFDAAEIEQSKARRFKRPLSVLMMSVDHFNQINDSYGHSYGDSALKQISKHLKQHSRLEDHLCRLSGKEFAICSTDTDLQGAIQQAERIREHIEENPVLGDSGIEVPVTVSIGVAQLTDSDYDISSLLNRASQHLKDAKHQGRNRVIAE